MFTQYIYPNQTVIRCASYIHEKDAYMWVRGFCPREGIKKESKCSCPRRRNVLPLKIALDLPIALNGGV